MTVAKPSSNRSHHRGGRQTRVEFNERLIYSEPSAENMERAFEILAYCCRMTTESVQNMNAFELLDHLFDDDRIKQVLFQPGGSVCLFNPWNKGEGALGVMMLHFCAGGQLRGSNRALVNAQERVFFKNGGKMWLNSPVERIVVENGVATGIQMKENSVMFPGQVIKARKAVVSNVGVIGTRELVGINEIEKADRGLATRMRNWDVKHRPSTCTVWNLKRPPRWKALDKNSYCKRADWVYIGLDGQQLRGHVVGTGGNRRAASLRGNEDPQVVLRLGRLPEHVEVGGQQQHDGADPRPLARGADDEGVRLTAA